MPTFILQTAQQERPDPKALSRQFADASASLGSLIGPFEDDDDAIAFVDEAVELGTINGSSREFLIQAEELGMDFEVRTLDPDEYATY